MHQNVTVTIVVPIFNAYEDTQRCLESVLQHTNVRYPIVLIDDASPDLRLGELVDQIAANNSHVTAYKNPQNLGFVETCNLAFELISKQGHDVLLLNSDTLVTVNWLEKMIAAAYSSEYIGTVTPLTNNGTICSVPNWLESNEIPAGQTLESFSQLIESKSLQRYPRVPTAVGFCMYIKQEILKKVGYFDAVNFRRGYGEENDLCRRASKHGYFHIIDDSTFVYHAGSKSFTSSKQKLLEENSKILARLHPNYFPEVKAFIIENPLRDIIQNIQLNLDIEDLKANSPICFILHNGATQPSNHPLGGTEYHCNALISSLRHHAPIYCIHRDRYKESIELEIFYGLQEFHFSFPCQFSQPYSDQYFNHDASFLKLFIGILNYFKPSIVHIHHLKGLPFPDVLSGLLQVQIPYVVSLHDYYLICPSYNLLDYKRKFCFEYKTQDYCRTCVQTLFGEGDYLREQWFRLSEALLERASRVIAPSQTALSYFEREYTSLRLNQKSIVIRHGSLSSKERWERSQFIESIQLEGSKKVFRVALVGSINFAKGAGEFSTLLGSVWKQKTLRECFSFQVFGRLEGTLPSYIQNVTLEGEYNRTQLKTLLQGIDLAIFPCVWAETYCLAVDEVIAAKVPVLVTPLSAAAERVREFQVGWVSNSESAADMLKVLVDLKNYPEQLVALCKSLQAYPIVSYEEMAQHYWDEYAKILSDQAAVECSHLSDVPSLDFKEVLAALSSSQTLTSGIPNLSSLKQQIQAMESSKFWKMRTTWFKIKQRLGLPNRP